MAFSLMRFVGVSIVGLAAAPAMAFVPWSNPAGTASFFTWSNGGSNLGLFGSPVLGGANNNLLVFSPSSYAASAANGSAQTTTDLLQVRLTANPGEAFTQIRILESGGFQLTGVAGASVSASGAMFITDMLSSRPTQQGVLLTNPGMPITTVPSAGNWGGQVVIDLAAISGAPWTDITLSFTNTLQATTQGASGAVVNKTGVTVEIVPTPGTAGLLILGGVLALRRRRR